MNIGGGIAFGLVAALCWGVADFCARGSSRSGGTFLTLFYVEILATLGMLLLALPLGLISFAHATPSMVALAVVINLAILGGAALLYRAFAIGTLSIVSPVAASFAALTALLSLLTGERAHALQLLGIALTVAGVTLASTVPSSAASAGAAEADEAKAAMPATRRHRLAPGLVEALSAMVVFGVCYWALRYPVAALGGVTVVFISKVADMVVMLLIALVGLALYRLRTSGKPDTNEQSAPWYVIRKPAPSFWLWVVGVALLDTAANIAYNLGITISLTAVVSVISSLFSAVTVLLAWVFLRERLARWQWAGVAAILVGIALVSV